MKTELFKLIFLKNHFKMMVSKPFNRKKKKIPCVGEIARVLFDFWHLCDPVITLPLLWRVLPVWDPNSCSGSPAMRPLNPLRGPSGLTFPGMNTHAPSVGAPELFHSTLRSCPPCFWKPVGHIRRLSPSSPSPIPTLQTVTWKQEAHSPHLANVSMCPKRK